MSAYRYPEHAGSKTGGASFVAARAVDAKAPPIRQLVLADLRAHGPSSPSTIYKRVRRPKSSVKPRISELIATGDVVKLETLVEGEEGKREHLYALSADHGDVARTPDDLDAKAATCARRAAEWDDRARARREKGVSDRTAVAAAKRLRREADAAAQRAAGLRARGVSS